MIEKLVRLLRTLRLSLTDEKELQWQLERYLTANGYACAREVALNPGDIIDFVVDPSIGIECKIKGSKRDIYYQCERYCSSPLIQSLVLVTNVPTGFPPSIDGKPVYLVHLGRAWL